MLCFCLGTRPEIIKLAPLIRRAVDRSVPFTIVHTGQHYDDVLDRVFFSDLSLPAPYVNLHAAAPSSGQMLARMFTGFETLWQRERPSVVIAEGDTNSVFAAAFCAQRAGIPFAHVEAGLRSDDWTMPEEMNRVLSDRLSERLYAPTALQQERLLAENISADRILVTGNTVADAVREHLPIARSRDLPASLADITREPYALLTLHRPALVDDPTLLQTVLQAVNASLSAAKLQGIFLVHPRTQHTLPKTNDTPAVHCTDPVGYLHMLRLLSGASLVITDSGGLQEEAALLRIPCVTVRENTERPETLRGGANRLVGFDPKTIRRGVEDALEVPRDWPPLYDIEKPADEIFADLLSHYA